MLNHHNPPVSLTLQFLINQDVEIVEVLITRQETALAKPWRLSATSAPRSVILHDGVTEKEETNRNSPQRDPPSVQTKFTQSEEVN